jgi:hypothetical protein
MTKRLMGLAIPAFLLGSLAWSFAADLQPSADSVPAALAATLRGGADNLGCTYNRMGTCNDDPSWSCVDPDIGGTACAATTICYSITPPPYNNYGWLTLTQVCCGGGNYCYKSSWCWYGNCGTTGP